MKLSVLQFKIIVECRFLQQYPITYSFRHISQLFQQIFFVFYGLYEVFVQLKYCIGIPINDFDSFCQKAHHHIKCYMYRQKVKGHCFERNIYVATEIKAYFLEMQEDASLFAVSCLKVARDECRQHLAVMGLLRSEMPPYS